MRNKIEHLKDLHEILPHKFPFRFIDKILELCKGRGIGLKNVTSNDYFFVDSKEHSTSAAFFIIESMAQIAGMVLQHDVKNNNKKHMFLAEIKEINFKRTVLSGDQLIITADMDASLPSIAMFSVTASVKSEVIAEGKLVIAVS